MTINVANWTEATKVLETVVDGRQHTLGTGYDYPLPLAVFTKDAWSGEGMGYVVWETKNGRPSTVVASISIGRTA